MTTAVPHRPTRRPAALAALAAMALAGLAAGCGGGNPLSNPSDVANPGVSGGQSLSFAYFQQCVFPIYLKQLQAGGSGGGTVNTCAASGCHDNVNGTGGALRLYPHAAVVDLTDGANTPDVIRAGDMYKNFYSSQGATIPGVPTQSRLFQKPLLLNTLHGGGLIFEGQDDPNAKEIAYWITHPMPKGQDEFGTAASGLFGTGGTCVNTTP